MGEVEGEIVDHFGFLEGEEGAVISARREEALGLMGLLGSLGILRVLGCMAVAFILPRTRRLPRDPIPSHGPQLYPTTLPKASPGLLIRAAENSSATTRRAALKNTFQKVRHFFADSGFNRPQYMCATH